MTPRTRVVAVSWVSFADGYRHDLAALSAIAHASSAVLAAAGTERIGAHVLALTDRLVAGLESLGAAVSSPRGEGISSGIVTFSLPGRESVALGRALGARGFVTTFRPSGVRVSPHGYNTVGEIDAFLEALA
jgi:cysteine desulfurase/selenocysteine lyase